MVLYKANILMWAVVFLYFTRPLFSSAPETEEPEAVSFRVRYNRGGVNDIVEAQATDASVYFSIRELFALLHVDCEIDSSGNAVRGFYCSFERRYEIDNVRHAACIDEDTLFYSSNDMLVIGREPYLAAEFFGRMFHLFFTIEMNQLKAVLKTEELLPVAAEREREECREKMAEKKSLRCAYPLLYNRKRALFGGGVADYTFTGVHTGGNTCLSATLRTGAEAFGGEFNGTVNMLYDRNLWENEDAYAQWRYVFDPSEVVSSVSLGSISAEGLTAKQFTGLQISNEPVVPREVYQTIVLREQTHPDWTVGVYADEKLVESKRADAAGVVQFDVPLMYGTNIYTLRMYGPAGEVEIERKRIQIPFAFVPPKTLDYTIDAGSLSYEHIFFSRVQCMYGISERVSNRLSLEFINDMLCSRPVLTDLLSLRLGESILAAVEASPAVRYGADVQIITPARWQWGISAMRFEKNEYYNKASEKAAYRTIASLPFVLGDLQSSLHAAASRTCSGAFTTDEGSAGFSVSPGSWSVDLIERSGRSFDGNVLYGKTSTLTGALLCGFSGGFGRSSVIGDLLLNTSVTFDQYVRKASLFSCNLSACIFKTGRCQIGMERDMLNGRTTATILLTFDFDCMHTASLVQYGSHEAATQTISGALVFDEANGNVDMFGRPWDGTTGAEIRMFLDRNGNGRCDSNESPVDGSAGIGHAAAFQKKENGRIKLWKLLPYERYDVDIRYAALENNLWVPKYTAFSFITDPNSLKLIDVPFVAVGLIEGKVACSGRDEDQLLTNVQAVVRREDGSYLQTIRIFQDGSLYYIGIPPGKYRISLDSIRLASENLISEPAEREFEIHATAQGDEVSGLDFVLHEINTGH
ncbi:MAG: hypothetical protein WAV76_05525 [Bacteroidota bacterium]